MKRLALLLFLCPLLASAEPASVIRATDLKQAPATDSATLAALPENAAVEALERKGGWTRVKTPSGEGWVRMLALRYKPGAVDRPPPFVAPHQPRVDFRLWFYGLDFRRGTPEYVVRLLERLCADPQAVAGLFADAPPDAPDAVRIAYWQYHFTTAEERERSGAWWRREPVGTTDAIACHQLARGSSPAAAAAAR